MPSRVSPSTRERRTPRPLPRTVAAGCVGLTLLGAAYQAAFAVGPEGRRPVIGMRPDYVRSSNGLSGGELAAIAGGSAVVAAGGLYAAGVIGGGAAGAILTSDRLTALPADQYRLTALRVVPGSAIVLAGDCRTFFAEGKSEVDGKWYSVTHRPETTFDIKVPSPCVVKQDGTKNVLCVPISTPADCDGKVVTVMATFAPQSATPLSAEATLTVRIAQD